ncbi:MAG: hypothetical protein H7096_14555, partial [Flavobacterium sp.]|nr:hypothetical protein [Pedobacter sp.]
MNKLSLLLTLISCFNLSFVSFSKAHNLSLNYQTEGCFTINTSGLIITPNTCGNKDGSVNGIAVNGEGKFTYVWKDSLSTVVGNGINLKDALAGTYKLEVRGADCVVQSISVTIDEIKTIVIDLSNVKIISAGCDNKGSVMGIKIYDATRVEWRSLITQTIVSNSADLVNLPVGIYKLTAYNATGCKKDAGTFNITSQTLIPRIENIDIEDPTCSESKGNVNIKLNILKEQENLSFTIVDSTGQVLESGAIVYNANFNIIDKNFRLPPGSFQMFVKGSSGCDILLTSFKLSKNELSLVSDSIGVFNDQCDQKIGRILGIKIKGLSKPPKGR